MDFVLFDDLKNKCRLCLNLSSSKKSQVDLTDEVEEKIKDFIPFEVNHYYLIITAYAWLMRYKTFEKDYLIF